MIETIDELSAAYDKIPVCLLSKDDMYFPIVMKCNDGEEEKYIAMYASMKMYINQSKYIFRVTGKSFDSTVRCFIEVIDDFKQRGLIDGQDWCSHEIRFEYYA